MFQNTIQNALIYTVYRCLLANTGERSLAHSSKTLNETKLLVTGLELLCRERSSEKEEWVCSTGVKGTHRQRADEENRVEMMCRRQMIVDYISRSIHY